MITLAEEREKGVELINNATSFIIISDNGNFMTKFDKNKCVLCLFKAFNRNSELKYMVKEALKLQENSEINEIINTALMMK